MLIYKRLNIITKYSIINKFVNIFLGWVIYIFTLDTAHTSTFKKQKQKKLIYMHCSHPGTLNLSDSVVETYAAWGPVVYRYKIRRNASEVLANWRHIGYFKKLIR